MWYATVLVILVFSCIILIDLHNVYTSFQVIYLHYICSLCGSINCILSYPLLDQVIRHFSICSGSLPQRVSRTWPGSSPNKALVSGSLGVSRFPFGPVLDVVDSNQLTGQVWHKKDLLSAPLGDNKSVQSEPDYLFSSCMKNNFIDIYKSHHQIHVDEMRWHISVVLHTVCVNNLAPAVLCPYVTNINTNRIATRGSANGNCREAQCKKQPLVSHLFQ